MIATSLRLGLRGFEPLLEHFDSPLKRTRSFVEASALRAAALPHHVAARGERSAHVRARLPRRIALLSEGRSSAPPAWQPLPRPQHPPPWRRFCCLGYRLDAADSRTLILSLSV